MHMATCYNEKQCIYKKKCLFFIFPQDVNRKQCTGQGNNIYLLSIIPSPSQIQRFKNSEHSTMIGPHYGKIPLFMWVWTPIMWQKKVSLGHTLANLYSLRESGHVVTEEGRDQCGVLISWLFLRGERYISILYIQSRCPHSRGAPPLWSHTHTHTHTYTHTHPIIQ